MSHPSECPICKTSSSDVNTTENLHRLINTLRSQSEEKEQRIKALSVEIHRLRLSQRKEEEAGSQQRQPHDVVQDDVHQLKSTLATKDREIERLDRWLVQTQSQMAILEEKLQAAGSSVKHHYEVDRLRMQRLSNATARRIEETTAEEMQEVLHKQGVALLSSCARHLEEKDNSLEQLKFEVTKQSRIMSSLTDQLRESQRREQELKNRIDEMESDATCAQEQLSIAQMKGESKLNAEVAFNSAYMDAVKQKCETLERKMNGMEDLLRQKDSELQSLQFELNDRETAISHLKKKMQAMEFDLSVKNMNLVELEKDRKNNEQVLLSKLELLESNRQTQLRQASECAETRICEVMAELAEKDSELFAFERRLDQINDQREADYKKQEESDKEKESLKLQLIELEVALSVANNTRCLLEASQQRECELKRKLIETRTTCQALQQSSIELQAAYHEIRKLQKRLEMADALQRTGNGTSTQCWDST